MLSSASALQLQVHPRGGLAGLATDLSAPLLGIFEGDAEISSSEAGFPLFITVLSAVALVRLVLPLRFSLLFVAAYTLRSQPAGKLRIGDRGATDRSTKLSRLSLY